MIVKMINPERLWIPTPKLFFKILDRAGLRIYSKDDYKIIEDKLNEAAKKDYSGFSFAIRFAFNIKDGDSSSICRVRIIQSKEDKGDNCSGCVILAMHRKHSDREKTDFDFEFSREDM